MKTREELCFARDLSKAFQGIQPRNTPRIVNIDSCYGDHLRRIRERKLFAVCKKLQIRGYSPREYRKMAIFHNIRPTIAW